MAEYRYYLIPDFMSHVFPQQFEEQAPTEFFSNTADLMKRYKQLREMPYNNEYTWNERTNLPYPRLTVGIDRRDPDGAVTIMHVRNGVNYLCDDYRGPFADRNDKQLIEMAKQLVTAVGVDRIRPHYYTEENGHTKVYVGKDIHITEWANAPELCRALHFSRFLNRDGQQLFQVRNGQRIIENYADGSRLPGGIGNMPVAMELMVVSWMLRLVNIVINTIVAARFIELYVYNALASLPIATLCYRELHGIAVNFLKNYMAVALQGAVLYLVIGFYPALTASLGSGGDITEQAWAMLGKSVILLVAVFMSGRFTKAITSAI